MDLQFYTLVPQDLSAIRMASGPELSKQASVLKLLLDISQQNISIVIPVMKLIVHFERYAIPNVSPKDIGLF